MNKALAALWAKVPRDIVDRYGECLKKLDAELWAHAKGDDREENYEAFLRRIIGACQRYRGWKKAYEEARSELRETRKAAPAAVVHASELVKFLRRNWKHARVNEAIEHTFEQNAVAFQNLQPDRDRG